MYQQPPSNYWQPGQFLPPPPPPKPTFRQRLNRLPKKTKFGLGCGTLLLILAMCVCSSVAASTGSRTGTPVADAQPTAGPTQPPTPTPPLVPTKATTAKPTVVAVKQPAPKPTQQAVLGAPLASFQTRYGTFTQDSYMWTHSLSSDPQAKSISLITSKTSQLVLYIGFDNLLPKEMVHACDIFLPKDAKFIKKYQKTGGLEYSSQYIARQFPDPYHDYVLPPEKVGYFGLAFFTDGNNPNLGQCFVQIG